MGRKVGAMREFLEKAMTFAEYTQLIDTRLAEGRSTGPDASAEMYNYAKLNRHRMNRLEKTIGLDTATAAVISGLEANMIWLVITEGWCGDAAQNIPVIEKVAAAINGVSTRYILRDEYPELMDQFLTNGARSIPILIAMDARTYEVLGTWGSRPRAAQEYFLALKAQGLEKPEINEKMQRWYNEDMGRSLQAELSELATQWSQHRNVRSAAN